MAAIYITNSYGHYIYVEHDDVAEEITDIFYGNLTDTPWVVKYKYRNRPQNEVTIPAQTEGSIAIPPGQRQFVAALQTHKKGYHSQIEGMTY